MQNPSAHGTDNLTETVMQHNQHQTVPNTAGARDSGDDWGDRVRNTAGGVAMTEAGVNHERHISVGFSSEVRGSQEASAAADTPTEVEVAYASVELEGDQQRVYSAEGEPSEDDEAYSED